MAFHTGPVVFPKHIKMLCYFAHLFVSKVIASFLGTDYIFYFLEVFPEGVILTCLLLFGSAGILKVWTGLIVSPFRSRIRIQD